MKILITGGAGYIGSILTRTFLNLNYKVTVFDNFLFKQDYVFNDLLINKNFNLIKGDVRNFIELKKIIKKNDIIIPLAAIVGAPICALLPSLAKQVNLKQIKNIKSCLSKNQLLILPVTNSGYGIGEKNKVYYETSPLNPISL